MAYFLNFSGGPALRRPLFANPPSQIVSLSKTAASLLFRFTLNTEEWCGFFLGVLGTAGQKSWSSLRAWTSAVPSPQSIMHAWHGQCRSIIRADATHPPGSRYG